jgi:hypothetical protein
MGQAASSTAYLRLLKSCLLLLLPAGFCYAQEQTAAPEESTHEVLQVSLMGNFALPSPEFQQAVNNGMGGLGVGGNVTILVNPYLHAKPSPVFVGLDLSYLTFGRDKQAATNDAPPYKTSFNHYAVGGVSRLFLNQKPRGFTPFIDGVALLKIYNTRTKIDKNVLHFIFDEDQPEVIHTSNDLGLGYGLAIGFYTRNPQPKAKEPSANQTDNGSFSLRLLYLWGDRSSYVKRGSLQVEEGLVSYEQGRVNTNMLMLQLGLCLY